VQSEIQKKLGRRIEAISEPMTERVMAGKKELTNYTLAFLWRPDHKQACNLNCKDNQSDISDNDEKE